MNDVIVNKIQTIQRCVQRAREEYRKNPGEFDRDYTVQDAAVLNVLRACEQAIDLANHIIKSYRMGIPTSSNESFDLLEKKQVIDHAMAAKLKSMVGFRNIVIHEYKRVNLEIVRKVITKDLDDVLAFVDAIMDFVEKSAS